MNKKINRRLIMLTPVSHGSTTDSQVVKLKLAPRDPFVRHTKCPSECTYHSVAAIKVLAGELFESFVECMKPVSAPSLGELVRSLIVIGSERKDIYEQHNQPLPLNAGCDLEKISEQLDAPELRFGDIQGKEIASFEDRLSYLAELLYSKDDQDKAVWIKSGSGQVFSIVKKREAAMIFDSHGDELLLAKSKDALITALREKLEPSETNPFTFALSTGRFGGGNGGLL